jgi:hypothetical protein
MKCVQGFWWGNLREGDHLNRLRREDDMKTRVKNRLVVRGLG